MTEMARRAFTYLGEVHISGKPTDNFSSYIAGYEAHQVEAEKLVEALEYFVNRCEHGSIRSLTTYNYFKKTLADYRGEK